MKTIKIIDLLNKIANGEAVPRKIRYLSYEYTYNRIEEEYQRCQNELRYGLGEDRRLDIILDDEVEILEEKKIPEKLKDILRVDDLIPPVDENMYKIWKQTIKNQNKINEILDYLESEGE